MTNVTYANIKIISEIEYEDSCKWKSGYSLKPNIYRLQIYIIWLFNLLSWVRIINAFIDYYLTLYLFGFILKLDFK